MKIIIDYKLNNWNDTIKHCRYNKYSANSIKQKEMDIVGYYLRNVPRITEYPIELKCMWHVRNINSDLDNKSLKSVLDEMQKLSIIENDNIKHINKITYEAIKDDKDYLEIEITKAKEK